VFANLNYCYSCRVQNCWQWWLRAKGGVWEVWDVKGSPTAAIANIRIDIWMIDMLRITKHALI